MPPPCALRKLPCLVFFLVLVMLGATLGGCCTKGSVRASEVQPAYNKIRERHDKYVRADGALTESQVRRALRTTELFQVVLTEAQRE